MSMGQVAMDRSQEKTGDNNINHIPVMLNEVVSYLKPKPGNLFVDGTLGLGGHAEVILDLIGAQGRLIGIDRDAQALDIAQKKLINRLGRCDLVHENYCNLDKILTRLGIQQVDGILLDLGLSSFQLDNPLRGFGFREEGPLDMRMDQNSPITALDLVNGLSEKEISTILKDFGQERWHYRIARFLVAQRSKKPIETTKELSDVVLRAMPRYANREKIHPATRTFQAFRIAVNRELEELEEALEKCVSCLKVGGRIGVIAFHSLEDRIVKHQFRNLATARQLSLVVKKPLRPSEGEIQMNPRARSARLRIAERRAP
jgi:16S rRNA (cytosine1402-N4)-methyltransferase